MLVVSVGFVAHVAKDVEGVAVTVHSPSDVQVGQTFDLEINVTNERPRKVLQLSDIDIAEQYLTGFTVVTVKPPQKSSMHVPVVDSQSFTFDTTIAAGTSQTFTFTLRAEKEGIFRGDVDISEGMRTLTSMAQTVVKAKE